jgi:hypothetical protein
VNKLLSPEQGAFFVIAVTPRTDEVMSSQRASPAPCSLSSVRTGSRRRSIVHQLTDSRTHGLHFGPLLSALVVAGSLCAAPTLADTGAGAAGTFALADAATPEATPASSHSTATPRSQEDRVETRIKELHQKLKITAAQESQWNSFAEVMRDNAQTVDAVLKERSENIHAMSAMDDLRSYQKLADAHADGLKKLVPAFETLYNSMSEDQKKTADIVFAEHEKRPQRASGK